MTKLQKVKDILLGILMIIGAFGMLFVPKESYLVIIVIIALWFVIKGISGIYYYFTMAQFMVGGRASLFMGIIMLDFGIVAASLTDVPHVFVMLYLIAILGFSGVVRILRTLESRKNGSKSWKLKLTHGIIDIAMAVVCIFFIKQLSVTVIIFCVGIFYSAAMRIISACRKTDLIVIE